MWLRALSWTIHSRVLILTITKACIMTVERTSSLLQCRKKLLCKVWYSSLGIGVVFSSFLKLASSCLNGSQKMKLQKIDSVSHPRHRCFSFSLPGFHGWVDGRALSLVALVFTRLPVLGWIHLPLPLRSRISLSFNLVLVAIPLVRSLLFHAHPFLFIAWCSLFEEPRFQVSSGEAR